MSVIGNNDMLSHQLYLMLCRQSHGEENGNPLLYSFLESSIDKGAWKATVHGVTEMQIGHSD